MTGASGPIKTALDYNVELGAMRVLPDVDAPRVSEVVETVLVVISTLYNPPHQPTEIPVEIPMKPVAKKDASNATPVLSMPFNILA